MRVELPISKSCYARIAMICAIAGIDIPYSDENDDIIAIREALSASDGKVYVRSSGTATRFSIAYYASQECEVLIDGNEQMRKRPISSILEAVETMGAKIEGNTLPIRLKGQIWKDKTIEVDASQSSQTISALMLAGMKQGITIRTRGERNSWSYVELTAAIMSRFGAKVVIDSEMVRVDKVSSFTNPETEIDKDWSSAVFWYGWCATREENIEIAGLKRNSYQPDEAAVDIFEKLGVRSEETKWGINLTYNRESAMSSNDMLHIDCRRTPDLAMVLIPTLCKLGKRFNIDGLETLDKKESKRGSALCNELKKAGYDVEWTGNSLSWNGKMIATSGRPDFYDDHRIVMAHAILGTTEIDFSPLEKSYPRMCDFF